MALIFEAKDSIIICYDARGLFYLEEKGGSKWDLMLWDGSGCQMIEEIKINDMDQWIFYNGIAGNIIIENDFFATIHTQAEQPYVQIQSFNNGKVRRILLEKWLFSEADIARFGETFSGICYEDGEIINYFFSDTAGELKIQKIDISK